MKSFKFNTKKLILVIISIFIVVTSVACSKENKEIYNNSYVQESNEIEDNSSYTESKKEFVEEESNPPKLEEKKEEIESKIEEVIKEDNVVENNTVKNCNEESYTSSDKEVINYFNGIEDSVDNELEKKKSETTKDKLKGTFITIVDFIFYDSEINGIKFDDLTEGAKQNVLETVSSIDNKIMTKYPNYKEEISSKTKNAYNKASELIKKGANNVKEFSKEKLGEENYNAIIDAKDELVYYTKKAVSIIGDIAGSIWETGKSKIKSWYEKFRN